MVHRQALHVLLSDTAQRGLRDFAERHGISLAGLLEAVGCLLAGEIEGDDSLVALGHTVVERARAIDVERRARGRALRAGSA